MIKLTAADERRLRRTLLPVDPVLAMHMQIRNYFLTAAPEFGVLALDQAWSSLVMYSTNGGLSFFHYYLGDVLRIDDFRLHLGKPCQAFLRENMVPDPLTWKSVLHVTPGTVVDHPAYSGVFSRVAPRFAGTVYEHE